MSKEKDPGVLVYFDKNKVPHEVEVDEPRSLTWGGRVKEMRKMIQDYSRYNKDNLKVWTADHFKNFNSKRKTEGWSNNNIIHGVPYLIDNEPLSKETVKLNSETEKKELPTKPQKLPTQPSMF